VRRLTLLFLSLLLFFSCSKHSLNYSHIRVIKVIDGDTVILENGEHLRYLGIDTPEIRKKVAGKWIFMPQPFSLQAKEFNKNLVEKKFVRVEFDVEKRDRYNRLLGYVFVDKTFVNERLVKEGLAIVSFKPPNLKYLKRFLKAQEEARFNKKGLWAYLKPISPAQAQNFIGEIRTVKGRILDCYCLKDACFLNFGTDYKKDFTITIFKRSFPEFQKRGIDICPYYKNKEVEITGRLREYNGPEIIANLPQDIKVISE